VKIELLIVDATVLLDFCKTDTSVLTRVTKHVGAVHVAEPVLAEVRQLDRVTAESLGLLVVQTEFALLTKSAKSSVRSALRFKDWLCLLLAEQESWTCVTNDERLRIECEARSVSVMWGHQLLLRLVEHRALSSQDAIDVAEAMHKVNRRIPREVVDACVLGVRKVK
jgi:hypothetical protein